MFPFITVVLPVYNQEKFIAETIESVLNQTYVDFELLIMDDGSIDGSARIIDEYSSKDNRISTFFQKNSGRCIATNNIIEKARGKWCALLDADDVMLPNRLEKQVAFHMSNPDVDASSCHCYYINENGNVLGEQRHPYLKTIEEYKSVSKTKVLVQCAITGLFISKKVFLEAGGLKSQYWPCDDFEFFNRLIEKEYILLVQQQVLMKYRIHAQAITVNKPLHTYDVTGYVMKCIELRRSGKFEITFNEFTALRAKDAWWVKLNRRRYNYSQIFFRNAAISMMSKKYLIFSMQVLTASLLDPNYVYRKAISLARG